jgi:hypothetical protein
MEKRVFDGLKAGNEVRVLSLLLLLMMLMMLLMVMMTCDAWVAREQVLKEIQAEMSLDAVEELMADTHEAIAHQQVRHLCTTHPPPFLALPLLFTHLRRKSRTYWRAS